MLGQARAPFATAPALGREQVFAMGVVVLAAKLSKVDGAVNRAEIDAFLDRRIENVMQFEKLKTQAKDAFANFPDQMDLFGQRRG